MNINEEAKRVYIDVDGFISKKEASDFLRNYNQTVKNKKMSSYKLIVSPSLYVSVVGCVVIDILAIGSVTVNAIDAVLLS